MNNIKKYKKGSTGMKISESIIKDGCNYVKKYVIIGCKSESVKVSSSGCYSFNDISLSKFERG